MMDLPVLTVAVLGLAAFSMSDGAPGGLLRSSSTQDAKAEGPAALVGEHLWATEEPIQPWIAPVRAEELSLEDLGVVAEVRTSPEGEAQALVVAVGGLWGFGAQEVEMGLERLHLVRGADGEERLVLDLSASGAEPPIDGESL
jgi:hypothetical protein